MRFRFVLVLLLIFLLSGCGLPLAAPETPTPIPTSTPLPTPAPLPTQTLPPIATQPIALKLEALKNFTYHAPQYKKTVQLSNGKYEAGSGADYYMAALLDQAALGDLNGDGLPDAAVLLAENGGGSGVFVSLIVLLNDAGNPRQAGAVLIDDRPQISSLAIQEGQVQLEAVIHGPGDAMVSPSLSVRETFRLDGASLVLSALASKPAGGDWRSIQIESPVENAQEGASVQVKGSMPIAPFENNLSYRVYDAARNLLAQGPFPVMAQDMGGPATFDNSLDLGAISRPAQVRLELWDVSMADGSPLAIASVRLSLK